MDKSYQGRSLVGDNSVNSVKYLGLSDGFPIQMVLILDGNSEKKRKKGALSITWSF